jgi:hypothetical protein
MKRNGRRTGKIWEHVNIDDCCGDVGGGARCFISGREGLFLLFSTFVPAFHSFLFIFYCFKLAKPLLHILAVLHIIISDHY